jgi:hypothetical protein
MGVVSLAEQHFFLSHIGNASTEQYMAILFSMFVMPFHAAV